MTEAVIELQDVSLTLGEGASSVHVLKNVSLAVNGGEATGIVGPSGSGKSTLLMVIAGLEKVDAGVVRIAGETLSGKTEDQVAAFRGRNIGIVFQSFHLIPNMTALENVAMPLFIRRMPRADAEKKAAAVLSEVGLGHRLQHTPSELSGGERQRAAIARALVTEPKLIMLDEPSLGLAPVLVKEIFAIIREINRTQRLSVLLVEQNATAALNVADHAYLIENGNIVMSGEAAVLKQNPDIQEFYLGGGERVDYHNVKHYRRRKRWLA